MLRALHPEIFLYAHHYLSVHWGALNTVVLLFSSFTMAWGVRAAQLGQTKLLVRLLSITLACAFVFLGVKFVEYKNKWEEALLPGKYYNPSEPPQGSLHAAAGGRQGERRGEAGRSQAGRQPEAGRNARQPIADRSAGTPHGVPPRAPLAAAVGEKSAIAPAAIGPTGLSDVWLDRKQIRNDRDLSGTARNRTTCSSSSAFTSS